MGECGKRDKWRKEREGKIGERCFVVVVVMVVHDGGRADGGRVSISPPPLKTAGERRVVEERLEAPVSHFSVSGLR